MSRTNKIIACIFCFAALFYLGYILHDMSEAPKVKVDNAHVAYGGECVDVTIDGEVVNAGTYTVNAGSTLYDAISLAGGITDYGDLSAIDVDRVITAPVSITVPKGDKSVASVYSRYQFGRDSNNHKLNINKASASQLSALEGIGDALAQRIVDYREKNGDFKSISDIMKVKGIGETKYSKFKDYITVGGEQG